MFKALLKTRLSALFYSMFRGSRRKKPLSLIAKIGAGLFAVYIVGCLFWLTGMLWVSLCEPFYRLGLAWLYFALVGAVTTAMCFAGSVFTTQKQIFAAKDNDLLLSMPIAPGAIIASRMMMLLLLNYMIEAIIVLPAAFVWAYSLPVSLTGAILFALAFLLLPLLPLTLSCVVGWLLEAVSSRLPKGRTLLTMVLSIAFLAAYFMVYSKMQEYLGILIANGTAVADAVKRVLPAFYWLGDAIASHNLVSLLLFCLCCALPFALVLHLISRSFLSIATHKTGTVRRAYRAGAMKRTGLDKALFQKELAHLLSNAMYMLNAGIGLVMALIGGVALIIKREEILPMLDALALPVSLLPAVLCAVLCFILSMTIISAPSISLEGKNLWIAQSIPVRGYALLIAKVRLQFYLSLPVSLVCSAIIAIVSGATGLMILALLVLPALLCLLFAQLGVIINLRFPKFDWTSEVAVVKQSLATLLAMFLNWGIVGLLLIGYLLLRKAGLSADFYLALCALVCIPTAIGLDRLLRTWGERTFEQLSA